MLDTSRRGEEGRAENTRSSLLLTQTEVSVYPLKRVKQIGYLDRVAPDTVEGKGIILKTGK